MNVGHAVHCANRHTGNQAPNDTLIGRPVGTLIDCMAFEFQQAFLWHMANHQTKIVDLVRGTGVSRDVINKLIKRDGSSTTVENAILIASFYGKTVNEFIQRQQASDIDRAATLFGLLTPEDRDLLSAQIRGILTSRRALLAS